MFHKHNFKLYLLCQFYCFVHFFAEGIMVKMHVTLFRLEPVVQ